MAGTTDTQSLRFGQVSDVIDFTMIKNLADDVAAQLDAADLARTAALKRPAASISRGATFTLPVSTITTVTFDTLNWDTHSMVNLGTQPQRYTVGATAGPGSYYVALYVFTDTAAWTKGDLLINKNGSLYAQRTWWQPQVLDYLFIDTILPLDVVTDFLTFSLYHEGGASTTVFAVDSYVQKVSG